MAIPWLVVLQSVPWAQVISNAPKVAEGARKLWNAVSKKSPVQEPPVESPDVSSSSGSASIATLQARLAAMEIATTDLHDQMLASSELIKTLADAVHRLAPADGLDRTAGSRRHRRVRRRRRRVHGLFKGAAPGEQRRRHGQRGKHPQHHDPPAGHPLNAHRHLTPFTATVSARR